jgi:hypothetical protein
VTNVRDWLLERVENLIVGFDKPGKNQRDQMGINGMRNLFENNQLPGVTPDEALKLGDKVHHILPALEDGERYELVGLSDGRTAVTIERGSNQESADEERPTTHDPFSNRNRIG